MSPSISRTTTLHDNQADVPSDQHHPPDISFPYLTSTPSRLAEREYREETSEGFIMENDLTPPGSPLSRPATITPSISDVVLHDLEKGKSKKKLVTFTEGDTENPRNWSKTFRWCECLVHSLLSAHIRHHCCSRHRRYPSCLLVRRCEWRL